MGILKEADRQALLQEHRTRIQALFHGHDPHAGFWVPLKNGPLNRSRTSPTGKQRAMPVPAAQRRVLKDLLGQDLAEGHHHRHIGIQSIQLLLALRVPSDLFRGEHRTAQLLSLRFHWRRHQLFAPTSSPIRLGHHTDDLMPCLVECVEGWYGVGRCAPEQDP